MESTRSVICVFQGRKLLSATGAAIREETAIAGKILTQRTRATEAVTCLQDAVSKIARFRYIHVTNLLQQRVKMRTVISSPFAMAAIERTCSCEPVNTNVAFGMQRWFIR